MLFMKSHKITTNLPKKTDKENEINKIAQPAIEKLSF